MVVVVGRGRGCGCFVLASHGDDRALEASERMMGEDAVVAWWGGGAPPAPGAVGLVRARAPGRWGAVVPGRFSGARV